jgi:trimeric autotransporter adhesin
MRICWRKIIAILLLAHSLSASAQQAVWDNMNAGFNAGGRVVYLWNGTLYAGGFFTTANQMTTALHVARWNGLSWLTMGAGFNGTVTCFAVYNNELYAGGYFTLSGSDTCRAIAKWNGTAWEEVGGGFPSGYVYAMQEYNGSLYVTGSFSQAGNIAAGNIASWNGNSWSTVGNVGLKRAAYCSGSCLEIWNNKLYVGGLIDSVDNIDVSNIAEWDGSSWGNMDMGLNQGVYALESYNGVLNAGGAFTATNYAELMQHLATWDGQEWSPVGNGLSGSAYSLYGYGDKLYIGGHFYSSTAVPDSFLTAWNGTAFVSVGRPSGSVHSICGDEGVIYATGMFGFIDNLLVRYVAKYAPPGVGIITNEQTHEVSLAPNPGNGIFRLCISGLVIPKAVEVYRADGTCARRIEFITEVVEIDLTDEKPGLFFYRIVIGAESAGSGTIILE